MAKFNEIKKTTSDNIEIKEIYKALTPSMSSEITDAGTFPFLRGIHANMYRGRPWTIRQYSGFGSVQDTNQRFRYLIENGATGLSVAFDLPTQMGLDSDDSLAEGEVGRTGVAIDSVEDMEALFEAISLDKVSTSMTINATAHILLAFYLVAAERRGIDWVSLAGTVQNDLLKEFIARGTYVFPPAPSLEITTDVIEFCSTNVKNWNPISISGYHMREAGCTAAQEIAFTILNGLVYIDSVLSRGLSIDSFAPRLAFFFNCHNNFFEEVSKFRAARKLWAKLVKDRYNPSNPKSLLLRFHTQTAGSSLTAQQPLNNIVRTSYQALAAVLGGTQSLHTNSYDEALSLPSEESAKLALRTQNILAEETGVVDVVDPLGGSFYVESLTNSLEQKAFEIIENIENYGGMLKAIADNLPQSMIEDAAYRYQVEIENEERRIVGVNSYLDETSKLADKPASFKLDTLLEKSQITKLQELRSRRDPKMHSQNLAILKSKAESRENIMPAVIDCARSLATIGEITSVLKGVFGRYGQGL